LKIAALLQAFLLFVANGWVMANKYRIIVFNMSKIQFESNSQQAGGSASPGGYCVQYAKDTI